MKPIVKEVTDEDVTDYPEPDDNGIVSSRFIYFKDMDDELLEMIFENDPELVCEKRMDFVKRRHPEYIH